MYSVWIGWIKICRAINDFIESIFEVHTRFITSHHKLVIGLCLLFIAIMAIGAVRFKALQRNEELFIPQDSEAFKDLERGVKIFKGLKFRIEEFIVATKDGSSIFDDNKALLKTLELHEEIIKIPNFKEICLTSETGDCMFVSVLEVFGYKRNNIEQANNSTKIKAKFNSWLANNNLLFPNGRPASLNFRNILGSYKEYKSEVISSDAVRLTYLMKYVNTADTDYDVVMEWEDLFITKCKSKLDNFKDSRF